MKNIVFLSILFAVILASEATKAQYAIPNGSFENWTSANKPANWTVVQGKPTQNQLLIYNYIDSIGDTIHFERSPYHGLSFIDMPMQDASTPCIISQKFAMSARPKYFSMNYAYFPETRTNQFQVGFIFTKWNTALGHEDTVLAGDYNSMPGSLAPQAPWATLLNADLTAIYNSNITSNPDSAIVTIISSLQASPNAKTLLAIDRIYFTDTIVAASIKLHDDEPLSSLKPSSFPNPFSAKTTIQYKLNQEGQVSLNVYDVNGRNVATLVNGNQAPGLYDAVFDASGLKIGMYYYRLQSENDIQTGKLILAK